MQNKPKIIQLIKTHFKTRFPILRQYWLDKSHGFM